MPEAPPRPHGLGGPDLAQNSTLRRSHALLTHSTQMRKHYILFTSFSCHRPLSPVFLSCRVCACVRAYMCTQIYVYIYACTYTLKPKRGSQQHHPTTASPGIEPRHRLRPWGLLPACPRRGEGTLPATIGLKQPLHLGESSRVVHLLHRILLSLDTKVSLAKG